MWHWQKNNICRSFYILKYAYFVQQNKAFQEKLNPLMSQWYSNQQFQVYEESEDLDKDEGFTMQM